MDNSILEQLGEQIKCARLRRNMSAATVACNANISRTTVWKIEKGDPTVCIGHYVSVLEAIGLEKDLLCVARDEKLAKIMEIQNIIIKRGME